MLNLRESELAPQLQRLGLRQLPLDLRMLGLGPHAHLPHALLHPARALLRLCLDGFQMAQLLSHLLLQCFLLETEQLLNHRRSSLLFLVNLLSQIAREACESIVFKGLVV